MATLKRWAAQVVAAAHNFYAIWPAWLQNAASLMVFALVAAAVGFGFHWPASTADLQLQLAAFAAVAYAIVVPIFQQLILPNLTGWLIQQLDLLESVSPKSYAASAAPTRRLPPMVILWSPALR